MRIVRLAPALCHVPHDGCHVLAARAREFFTWVKDEWDESGDNIFVWDFYELETEGTNYLLYSSGDSHPSAAFNQRVAPFISQRIADVIEGRGDTGSLTGE